MYDNEYYANFEEDMYGINENALKTSEEIERRRQVMYVLHTPSFWELSVACEGYDRQYPKDEYFVDIISAITGEVYASRDCYGLWEINA